VSRLQARGKARRSPSRRSGGRSREEGHGERSGKDAWSSPTTTRTPAPAQGAGGELGHDVLVAENGEQAAAHLCAQPAHLALARPVMPKVDGFRLLRRIRESRRCARCRSPPPADSDVEVKLKSMSWAPTTT
jgi:hypothetical protein